MRTLTDPPQNQERDLKLIAQGLLGLNCVSRLRPSAGQQLAHSRNTHAIGQTSASAPVRNTVLPLELFNELEIAYLEVIRTIGWIPLADYAVPSRRPLEQFRPPEGRRKS